MNKAELIAAIAAKTGETKKGAEAAVNALVDVVTEALVKGDKVQLVGFGSFEVRKRAARKGRNPQTKEEIKIPASKAPVFKAGKALKDVVNGVAILEDKLTEVHRKMFHGLNELNIHNVETNGTQYNETPQFVNNFLLNTDYIQNSVISVLMFNLNMRKIWHRIMKKLCWISKKVLMRLKKNSNI